MENLLPPITTVMSTRPFTLGTFPVIQLLLSTTTWLAVALPNFTVVSPAIPMYGRFSLTYECGRKLLYRYVTHLSMGATLQKELTSHVCGVSSADSSRRILPIKQYTLYVMNGIQTFSRLFACASEASILWIAVAAGYQRHGCNADMFLWKNVGLWYQTSR